MADEADLGQTHDEGIEEEIEEFAPGELCAVDAVTEEDKVDLEEEDDSGFSQEEKEGILAELCNAATQRDLTSYRLEVRDAWKARYFWRGNQFLLPGRNGAWVLPQLILVGGQSYDDHQSETNIYLAFGQTIIASLTAGTPSVRFEPDDPTNPADVGAAENSEGARRLIERANNMIVLQEDLARYLWTDSRCVTLTRYVIDGQRFGYEQRSDLEDEMGYLPELGEKIGEEAGEAEVEFDRGEPRGQEIIEHFGALESKLAIQANSIEECDYLIIAKERDLARMKTKYPRKADKMQPMQTPTANTEYMRLARTSIMTGMRPSNMTNDAMTYQATEQWAWFRPSFYPECKDETKREWLYDTFPRGCYVAMVGKTVVDARREQIDDHLTLTHAGPGDGMHRPALGQPLIPIQEKLNDCMDYTHDAFMHLVPLKWVDSEAVDTEALEELQTKPNQYVKMKRRPDKDMASNIFVEPQIQLAEGLMLYIQQLFGEMPQFLCGAFPALFGGDTGANDTAKGITSQRDQALGRVGLSWRNIKASYARIVRQAVAAAAKFRNAPMSGELQSAGGAKETINVDPEDLKGGVRCYPDTDENFPESWVAQRGIWQGLMAASAANPILAGILQVPRNLSIAKDKTGLPELTIPAAAAAVKQQGETLLLLDSAPVPNPALEQARTALQQLTPPPGTPPEQILMAQQKMAQAVSQIPPLVSSVPVDEELDDHQNEMAEIMTFANSPKGIKARAEKKDGFANLRLHYDEHKRALVAKIQQQMQAQQPQMKPISESVSVNFKDLPPEGQVQVAQKLGIQLNPQNLMQEDALEKAHDIKALATTPQAKLPAGGNEGPGQQTVQ
jgi:uncharacterized coiled-coil protein SlyX